MAWFTEEKLASLKITKDELSKSVVALFEKLDDVKDKDSMVDFTTSIKNLKNLKPVDKLFIAAFDPRLVGNVEEYIEELKNFRFIPKSTLRASLPLIYINTYGENEIEGRKDKDGNLSLSEDDIKYLGEKGKKIDAANESESNDEKKNVTDSGDKSQNQNVNDSNVNSSTGASA